MSGLLYEWFFFFQAEDGIRDGHVTGVQTCALPIYAIEQLNADPLDLIAADARGHRIARGCKIGVEEALRERTHGEPGNGLVLEHERAVANQRQRRMQFMGAPA